MADQPTYEELELRIKELEKKAIKLRRAEETLQDNLERLSKINECFLNFSPGSFDNINRLTSLCGELFGATCALYNRLDQGLLYSWGQWNTPPDYNPVDKPDGHICYDVIKNASDKVLVVSKLQETHYAQTDPNVIPYKLETYVGQAVKFGKSYVGALCVVFQDDFVPSEGDKMMMGIIASAIRVEEERRQAEEALRGSETRLEALSDASFEAIFLSDKGVCLDQNQSAERIFGYTRAEAIGRYGTEWIVPADREQVKNAMLSGYEKPYEVSALRKDGTAFPCEIQARMIEYLGQTIRVTALRDITERKRAEEAVQKSEEKFRAIFETAQDSIFIKDHFLKYTNVNLAMERLFELPASKLVGRTDEELFGKKAGAHIIEVDSRVLGGEVIEEEHIKPVQGIPKAFHVIKVPMKDASGKIIGLCGIARDITGRKQAEEELRKAHDELEIKVKKRTAELVKINEQMKIEIEERKQTELTLIDRRKELENKTHELGEVNAALNVLLKRREQDNTELEEKVLANVKELVFPYVEKLNNCRLNDRQMVYLNIINSNLEEIVAPFLHKLSSKYSDLTPGEIQVAGLVKDGKTTKDIAATLNSSTGAIDFHRNNLRKKLGLRNTKTNLRSFLLSFT